MAKTTSSSAKFEIITYKYYSFYGNRKDVVSNFEIMAEIFPDYDTKQLQELSENAENANTNKRSGLLFGQPGLKKKDTVRIL